MKEPIPCPLLFKEGTFCFQNIGGILSGKAFEKKWNIRCIDDGSFASLRMTGLENDKKAIEIL